MSEEALQIAEKRREVKGKEERERYAQLSAEFPRISRRDKKAFLSEQCKETEENKRMGKSRDLFKKIRDTKGTCHAKMGSVKARNGKDLTESELKKVLMTQITTVVWSLYLESDFLECEVKWDLGSIIMNKASGGDRIPAELFKIQKDAVAKVWYSICQQSWKAQQWPQDWKKSVFILIPKKGSAKECSNHC